MDKYQRLETPMLPNPPASSPALLVGSSAVRYALAHHSHVTVLGHNTVTFSEHGPLIWKRTRHQALLVKETKQWIQETVTKNGCFLSRGRDDLCTYHEWSSEISRQLRPRLPWTTSELCPLSKHRIQYLCSCIVTWFIIFKYQSISLMQIGVQF